MFFVIGGKNVRNIINLIIFCLENIKMIFEILFIIIKKVLY